jgi:hypothetical protein
MRASPSVGSTTSAQDGGVAQPLSEAVRSFLRVGSEIGHRIRLCVGSDAVTPIGSGGRLPDRAATFSRRLYAKASTTCDGPARLSSRARIPREAGVQRVDAAAYVNGMASNRRTAVGSTLLLQPDLQPDLGPALPPLVEVAAGGELVAVLARPAARGDRQRVDLDVEVASSCAAGAPGRRPPG